MTTANKVLKIEKSYVRQTPYGASNKFNNHNGQPWCGYFQKYCLSKAGKDLKAWIESCPNPAYVPSIMSWAKSHNRWTYNGKTGDLVLFDWNSNKSPDHIGMLIRKSNGVYITVEGNTSNISQGNGGCVQVRRREPWCILGFVRPPYKKAKKKKAKKIKTLPTTTLKAGSTGSEVKLWQKFLNSRGYDVKVDGDFGAMTRRATIAFQKKHSLEADGVVGPETRKVAQKIMASKNEKK